MGCRDAGACPTSTGQLNDFHGVHPFTPALIYRPRSKNELVAAVQHAEKAGAKVKAIGSNLSLSDVAVVPSNARIISTDGLDRHVTQGHLVGDVAFARARVRYPDLAADVLRGLLVPAARARGPRLVYVEGGMPVRALLADLATSRNPGADLPAMGAGGYQSVAGALATGTHGSEVDRQPLIDSVRAVHLVGPGGQEWWIERSNGFSSRDRISGHHPDWCDDTKIVYDDGLLYAALVGLGRLGAIYALVLEVEEQYWLDERRGSEPWAPVRDALVRSVSSGYPQTIFAERNGGSPGLRFFQVALNPNDLTTCWTVQRTTTAARTEIGQPASNPSALTTFCDPVAQQSVGIALAVVLPLIDPSLAVGGPPLPPLLDPLTGALVAGIQNFLDERTPAGRVRRLLKSAQTAFVSSATLGEAASRILQENPSEISAVTSLLVQTQHAQVQRVARAGAVLDQQNYSLPPNCYQGRGSEFHFNAGSARYLDYIDELNALAAQLGGIPGYVSLRYIQHSDAFLAMERWPLTVAIEISCLNPWPTSAQWLEQGESLAIAAGGVPHWGQQTFGADLSRLYGPAGEIFRIAVARVRGGGADTFASPHASTQGLDPPAGASPDVLAATFAARPISLHELMTKAQAHLALVVEPTSVREIAANYSPSLRMNPDGVDLPLALAASTHRGVSVRDLALRFP